MIIVVLSCFYRSKPVALYSNWVRLKGSNSLPKNGMFCISKQSPSLLTLHIYRAQDTIRYWDLETSRPRDFSPFVVWLRDLPSNNELETPSLWIPHRPVSDRQWAAIHLYVISKMFAWNKAEKWKWSLTGAGRAT